MPKKQAVRLLLLLVITRPRSQGFAYFRPLDGCDMDTSQKYSKVGTGQAHVASYCQKGYKQPIIGYKTSLWISKPVGSFSSIIP